MKTLARMWSVLCFAFLGLVLTGCEHTSTSSPMGALPFKLEKKEWSGEWLLDAGASKTTGEPIKRVVHVRITDEENGKGVIGIVDYKGGKFTVQDFSFASLASPASQGEATHFLNFTGTDGKRWIPMILNRNGSDYSLHFLNPQQLRKLSKAGKLPPLPEIKPNPNSKLAPDQTVMADEAFTAALQKLMEEPLGAELVALSKKEGLSFRLSRLSKGE